MDGELDATAQLQAYRRGIDNLDSALVHLLSSSDRPLTIPEILTAKSGMPQSSVYRNLAVLEEAGLVQRVASSDDWARFELAEDLTGHHHHQICTQCGEVRDFTLPGDHHRIDTDDRSMRRLLYPR